MEKAEIEGLWTHIHWLSVLEEHGTYTAAAARLGVSKSAVSQRISDLEKATGTRLVTRTTRSVRLTDAGQSLTRDVRSAYEQIARSFSSVRDSAGEIRGLVRLTAPVAFARQQLVPHLSEFLQQYPQVRIQLDVSDALSSLAAEGYDLAVRHGFQVPETHVAWKLCDTGSVLVATRDYLQRHGEPRQPGDLSAHNCLFYPRGTDQPAWTFERGTKNIERLTVPIAGSFATNNSEALRDSALNHLGIALLPDFSAHAALASGKLVQVLKDWTLKGAFADEIYLIRPYSPHVPKSVSALVSYLKGKLSAGFRYTAT
ncbi:MULTISPECIES: LysR family transcriptional regulator [Pseudomonas]|uniref:LysR family transcriptional regulator n=1 Tax=Pseudomonas pergaminensis TaxID=2853159 RepID=A0ABD7TBT7_9PSED|nr:MULTISPECIES: LysR family transcriptional regulator [Pseudomonas]PIB51348.1 LysR family transcriptional regulator [Pseudomonas sp. 2588-5]AQT95129.1 LysR family transcriptional regulator [Pseudomonas azotoformans]MBT1259744.1 LysR family transcriptional regulator [Pseudomonas sp. VS40]MBT1272414.1 LysR family transcriptional regulator [Pseudomonas sp. VS59]PJK32279.1 LysR family transcriptional regulator [Pseudomonas sp. S09F 262]